MFRTPLTGVVLLLSVWSQLVKPNSQFKPNCEYLSNETNVHSFLWTLKKDPPSYLFGTIHVPYTRVWHNIPGNVKTAFQKAHKVFFELDLTNPHTISSLANCQLLPKGESLDKVLPRKLYRRLKSHLDYVKLMIPTWMTSGQTTRGLYGDYLFNAITGNWKRKRPVWVMLMVNSLTENDIRWRGTPVLDLYLAQEAIRMHKETGAVERVQEQCLPLNQLSHSQVMFALNQTLLQHEAYRAGQGTTPYTTEELIQHYNCGDLNAVIFNHDTAQVPNLINTSLSSQDTLTAKNIDSYFRQELIFKRNLRMARRISNLLDTHPNTSFFFAFGAGHFLGNSTVIDHLRQWGYSIEHTQPSYDVDPGNIWDSGPKKDKKNPLLHMSADFPVSSIIINGDLDPFYSERRRHRHRHGNKKKRQRDRHRATQSMLKKPMFNDLWVRLQATSFGPDAFFRRYQIQPTTPQMPVRQAVHSGAATFCLSHTLQMFMYSFIVAHHTLLCFSWLVNIYIYTCSSSLPHN